MWNSYLYYIKNLQLFKDDKRITVRSAKSVFIVAINSWYKLKGLLKLDK